MANVRGLLVLSLVGLLLCQMMSVSVVKAAQRKCQSAECGTYYCRDKYICNLSKCKCAKFILFRVSF
ncbi:hypothetical protein LSAT2_027758 [Lamellibrachia satsuma]|nr:hypothetical protein LSAT2_027758 [Lamellibrachia satsuma]